MKQLIHLVALIVIAAPCGFASVVLPVIWRGTPMIYMGPPRPVPRPTAMLLWLTGMNKVSWLALGLLFISGFLISLWPRQHPIVIGMCVVSAFPLLLFADMMMYAGSTSHNLWPFSILSFGVLGLVPALGASVPHHLRSEDATADKV